MLVLDPLLLEHVHECNLIESFGMSVITSFYREEN